MCACTLTAVVEYVYWGWGCDVFGYYYHFHVLFFSLSTSYFDSVHFEGIAVEGMVLWIKGLTPFGRSFHCVFFLLGGGGGGWQSREGLGYFWFASSSLWKLFLRSFFISHFSLILFSSFEKNKSTSEHGLHTVHSKQIYAQFSEEEKTLG